ncbi:MAG: biotin--[acetyl-CoA-carboxylase] ligase [Ginsengibacter sp.]
MNAHTDSPFIILETVDSTNNYAMGIIDVGLAEHGFTVMALEQTGGKGRQGKTWLSPAGQNLMFSIIMSTDKLTIQQQFKFTAAIALACVSFIRNLLTTITKFKVKWPNDIFINDRKAGGILIENKIQGSTWRWAVVGVGLNVNQIDFTDELKKSATSLKMETGNDYDLEEFGRRLSRELITTIENLLTISTETVMNDYNYLLFKKDEKVKLKKDNMVFETTIKSVDSSGNLITYDALERSFTVNEVSWIL